MNRDNDYCKLIKQFYHRFLNDKDHIVKSILYDKKKNIELTEFDDNSIFKINPLLFNKPQYCFVALEPNYGAINSPKCLDNYHFIHSTRTLLIHYIGYKLCNNKFEYHITDICKTPMDKKLRDLIRNELYSYKDKGKGVFSWYELLKKEVELLGNPKIIAIGTTVEKYLQNIVDFPIHKTIIHYGTQTSKYINKHYDENKLDLTIINKNTLKQELLNFSKDLFKHLNISENEAKNYLENIFEKDFSDFFIKKYLVYKDILEIK